MAEFPDTPFIKDVKRALYEHLPDDTPEELITTAVHFALLSINPPATTNNIPIVLGQTLLYLACWIVNDLYDDQKGMLSHYGIDQSAYSALITSIVLLTMDNGCTDFDARLYELLSQFRDLTSDLPGVADQLERGVTIPKFIGSGDDQMDITMNSLSEVSPLV